MNQAYSQNTIPCISNRPFNKLERKVFKKKIGKLSRFSIQLWKGQSPGLIFIEHTEVPISVGLTMDLSALWKEL